MKKLLILAIFFISIIGTLLHFTYEWSGDNAIVGMFSAVNESTWEHLKIAVVPIVLWGMIEYLLIGRKVNNFFFSKIIAILTTMLAIVILFYSYSYITGSDNVFVDILIFYIAIALGQYLSYKIMLKDNTSKILEVISFLLIILVISIFILFTFYPPKNFIFQDPVNSGYGIYDIK